MRFELFVGSYDLVCQHKGVNEPQYKEEASILRIYGMSTGKHLKKQKNYHWKIDILKLKRT